MDVYPPRPAPIDGDELMKAFYSTPKHKQTWNHAWWLINHAKLIEPKTGQWIKHNESIQLLYGEARGGVKCSECGYTTHNKMHVLVGCPWKYCPSCGCRMMEVEHETDNRKE